MCSLESVRFVFIIFHAGSPAQDPVPGGLWDDRVQPSHPHPALGGGSIGSVGWVTSHLAKIENLRLYHFSYEK